MKIKKSSNRNFVFLRATGTVLLALTTATSCNFIKDLFYDDDYYYYQQPPYNQPPSNVPQTKKYTYQISYVNSSNTNLTKTSTFTIIDSTLLAKQTTINNIKQSIIDMVSSITADNLDQLVTLNKIMDRKLQIIIYSGDQEGFYANDGKTISCYLSWVENTATNADMTTSSKDTLMLTGMDQMSYTASQKLKSKIASSYILKNGKTI